MARFLSIPFRILCSTVGSLGSFLGGAVAVITLGVWLYSNQQFKPDLPTGNPTVGSQSSVPAQLPIVAPSAAVGSITSSHLNAGPGFIPTPEPAPSREVAANAASVLVEDMSANSSFLLDEVTTDSIEGILARGTQAANSIVASKQHLRALGDSAEDEVMREGDIKTINEGFAFLVKYRHVLVPLAGRDQLLAQVLRDCGDGRPVRTAAR